MPSPELEREVKFEVTADFVLPSLDRIVDDGVTNHPLPERELDAQYFDTSDLRLARWGCTVRHRSDQGWCVKIPSGGDGLALARNEIAVEATGESPPDAAVRLVSGFSRNARLEPIVRLRATRRPTQVLDADGSELAELVDDHVIVERPNRPLEQFRMLEVELAGDIDLERVDPIVDELVGSGATLTRCTKVSRALGGPDGVADEVTVPPVSRYPTAREVAHAAIARSVRQVILNLPGVRLGEDPEDLHQARVGVRRLRSDLRTFGPLLDTDWAAGLRTELRFLGGALGAVRDLDVLLATLAQTVADEPAIDDEQAAPLLAWFESERTARRRTLMATLDTAAARRNCSTISSPRASTPGRHHKPTTRPRRSFPRSPASRGVDSSGQSLGWTQTRPTRRSMPSASWPSAAGMPPTWSDQRPARRPRKLLQGHGPDPGLPGRPERRRRHRCPTPGRGSGRLRDRVRRRPAQRHPRLPSPPYPHRLLAHLEGRVQEDAEGLVVITS